MSLKVGLVELDARIPNLTSQSIMPRHDILAVATAAAEAGHEVSAFVESLNGVDKRLLATQDVVGASVTGCNVSRVRDLFDCLRRENPSVRLIAGGPHATLIPTEVLTFADIVVRDEGEVTVVQLLAALENAQSWDSVDGISFRRGNRAVHTQRRTFLSNPGVVENLSLLRGFRRRSGLGQLLFQGGQYCGYAVSSRGCPYPCSFCYENMIGGTGFRKHSPSIFVKDVQNKMRVLGTRTFWLADSNFAVNTGHCESLLRALIEAELGCRFSVLCRIEIAHKSGILDLMARAGFRTVVLGLEATEDTKLQALNKGQTVEGIRAAVSRIHSHGLAVFGLFMVGFDDDSAETPGDICDFCTSIGVDGLSIYCLTEYPQLPGRTLPRYRICEPNLDYYNGHFVVTFPKRVRPSVLEHQVFEALHRFYSLKRIATALTRRDVLAASMALPLYWQVRKLAKISLGHQRYLTSIEGEYYDDAGLLREAHLRSHPIVLGELDPDILASWSDPASANEVS